MRKHLLTAGFATAALVLSSLAMAESTGTIQGTVSGGGNAPVQAPQTGPNGTAIPEVPANGTTTGARGADETTGSVNSGKQGGASAIDLQQKLSARGYSDIQPQGSGGASTNGETRFKARNAAGKDVIVTMNANTGAIVGERAAE